MQANKYLTFSKAILYYFKILEKLAVVKTKALIFLSKMQLM